MDCCVKQAGYVIEDIGVAVDYWHVVKKPTIRFFFLTHAHCDHMDGLTPSWIYPIYCSPTTAKVVSAIKGVDIKVFKQLELDTNYEILDEQGRWFMNVYLIDADHCPGSVMFLLIGEFGRILCTGDFRYERLKDTSPEGQPKSKINFDILNEGAIDRVFLDTTHWRTVEKLPSRKQLTQEIIKLMEKHNDCQFLIALPQVFLGREDMLIEIARHFESYISVSQKRMGVLEILEVPNVFTTGKLDNAQIRLIKLTKARVEFHRMLKFDDCNPFLIVPTSISSKLRFNFHENVRLIPYSDHSDRFEIESFLKQLNIRSIVGAPNTLTPEECKPFLSGVPPKQVVLKKCLRSGSLKLKTDQMIMKRKRPTGLLYGSTIPSTSGLNQGPKLRRLFNDQEHHSFILSIPTEPSALITNQPEGGGDALLNTVTIGEKTLPPVLSLVHRLDTSLASDKSLTVTDDDCRIMLELFQQETFLVVDDPESIATAKRCAERHEKRIFDH